MGITTTEQRPQAAVVAFVVVTIATCALHWPLPLHLLDHRPLTAFHNTQMWAFDHIAQMIIGSEPFSFTTNRIGVPLVAEVRFMAWVPALFAIPLQPLLGPLGTYNAVVLLSPAFSALAAILLIQRVVRAPSWVAAAAATTFALCPYVLGCMASGQVAKVQQWTIALYLLALHGCIVGPRRGAWLAGLGIVTVATSFTCPTYGLVLPLLGGFGLVAAIVGARAGRHATVGWAFAGVMVTGLCLLPAYGYYRSSLPDPAAGEVAANPDVVQAFLPAMRRGEVHYLDFPTPVAEPVELLFGLGPKKPGSTVVNHVAYLGLPLLILAGVLSRRRFPGRGLVWGLLGLGVVAAMGSYLALGTRYLTLSGMRIPLPMSLLEALGYPMRESGMYYRMMSVGSLGLAGAVAGGLGTVSGRVAIRVAWVAALVAMLDAVRATSPLFPLPVAPVPGHSALREMAADPIPGAVLDLPLEKTQREGDLSLHLATIHRRATTGLPQFMVLDVYQHLRQLNAELRTALSWDNPSAARAHMAGLGFRYVVWQATNAAAQPGIVDMDLAALERGLGPSRDGDELRYWVLEATP